MNYLYIVYNMLDSLICRTLESTRKYLEKVTTTKIKEEIETMSPEIRTKLKNTELRLKVGSGYSSLHEYEMSSLSNLVKSVSALTKVNVIW